MNRRQVLSSTVALSMASIIPTTIFAKDDMIIKPPVPKKIPQTIKQLGRIRTDDFGWMRDEKWQDVLNDTSKLSKEIRTYIEAENSYTDKILIEPTKELREKLFNEMKGRIKEDDATPPMNDGKFAYFRKYREGGQYPIIVRFPIDDNKAKSGDETIIIDGDTEAKGKKFWKLNGWEQNDSQDLIAYAVDFEGARNCDIKFRNPTNGTDLPETLKDTTGELVWAKDNRTCFYVKNDENVRPVKLMRHIVGTDPKNDVLVYEEKDFSYFLGIGKTSSGEYALAFSSASDNSECRFIKLSEPTKAPVLFSKRKAGFEYYPDHHGEYFYFRTNKDGAKDYKIMRTKITQPAVKNWQDYVKYSSGTLISDVGFFKDYMVRQEMFDALPRIVVHKIENKEEHSINFPEEAYDLNMGGSFEFDTQIMRFSYSSPTTPSETYDYDMSSRARKLLKRQEIPSGHNPQDYVVKRILAPSTDGAQVPVTILYKKNTPIDGSAPLHLYGYGSYGITIPDSFNANILNLVNRGIIFALAHIRGGMERGYDWYLNGKLRKKQNTFTDFIRAAEALIENKYTSKGKITAEGRSAGGLLMGVVANQRPDLFSGIVAGVAFVDMMNTISDETLPLTPPEWTEWGDPIRNEKDYDTMAAYSPYDNVMKRDYPPVFAQTALSDSQVTYWEPTKWIAKLRDTSPNAGPFLLRCNMDAGHGGASGRFDRLKEIAEYQAFVLWCIERNK